MLDSGLLREKITLQSPQTTRDVTMGGLSAPVWRDEAEVWAAIDAPSGRETNVAQQITAVITFSIQIRPRYDVRATWRVLWGRRVLSIEAILPSAAKDRTTLLCSEGLDQSDR